MGSGACTFTQLMRAGNGYSALPLRIITNQLLGFVRLSMPQNPRYIDVIRLRTRSNAITFMQQGFGLVQTLITFMQQGFGLVQTLLHSCNKALDWFKHGLHPCNTM